jgi:hypothetical protein
MTTAHRTFAMKAIRLTGADLVSMAMMLSAMAMTPVAAAYTPDAVVLVDSPSVPSGNTVIISGSGFTPFADVYLYLSPAGVLVEGRSIGDPGVLIGVVTTDANGDWTFAWDTTGIAPGEYVITATDGLVTATTMVTVTGASPSATGPQPVGPGGSGLPQSGGVSDLPVRLGVVLLVSGALVQLALRRRSKTADSLV